ncbi:hypothetical protein CS0771_31980 [Catellatospora sp. IY07-71]|uniref:hypothetical protein n=1 Tax=Catellatospora sp. IY07-71 TaxID=2728827 RepID=UPI001BB3C5D7|nr:hypothetical protein [Catellatospora sp. IY07-71]BCJ73654.1 hypothetical protein CS0771_31980 [Catellatospora sp. IY07-71]
MVYPIEGRARIVSRRTLLAGACAAVPGLILATGTSAQAGESAAGRAVGGRFLSGHYRWPIAAPDAPAGAGVSGVLFLLTEGGQPLAGRRVRFSISAFHTVDRSVWFAAGAQRKAVSRLGYLDLDTDGSGIVALDPWLRRGAVPTAATGAQPVLRAQLVGAETILASARVSVIRGEAR